jgi:hypothetical protein
VCHRTPVAAVRYVRTGSLVRTIVEELALAKGTCGVSRRRVVGERMNTSGSAARWTLAGRVVALLALGGCNRSDELTPHQNMGGDTALSIRAGKRRDPSQPHVLPATGHMM